MGSLRRQHPRPRSSSAAPLDDDNLLSEILLRLPPQPSSLPRASAVCRRWRLLISDPGFCRRFRLHHRRNPPLLGVLHHGLDCDLSLVSTVEAPNRFPAGGLSLRLDDFFVPIGCRHGLVLVFLSLDSWREILMWDPITAGKHRILLPPGFMTRGGKGMINGAVLRAAGDADDFQVVVVMADKGRPHRRAFLCVYSSKTGLWGELVSTLLPSMSLTDVVCTGMPAVLAGNSLYWLLVGKISVILEFDMEKQSLALIQVPVHMLEQQCPLNWIMRAEGGGLGLLFETDCSFQLWKRNTDSNDAFSWVLGRTIELEKLTFLNSEKKDMSILALADENNVMFMRKGGVVFMVHLDSLQFKKLLEEDNVTYYEPFESVYTTGI
ncbi:unnamed protein product [Triticum turgidum subsp. durum]|uniref:F-box domain-containing protein n=1 Tax=Triticum turgidum subsp. durum TaxID=4567 RepID=A0A9R0XUH5_TRITD|nr:unnamed protein product [Triticum turgidum subsp. durum]